MELPDEHTIRILLTTDNHVGYNESDPITGDDSWRTFHEIMMLAKSCNVDMVLQSGDLFHNNKPSKKSLYQVLKTLRMSCMGDRPCELELLSDPAQVFHYDEFTNVNYEDPNYNISIPMFGISGNHDDATGDALLCPMDILHVSGLMNHYGKVLESDKITISPLLFQKGNTKLALYGLASVRDERLFRTFKEGGVKFEVPTVRESEWFNLMCVHQNHTGHTNTAFLPEQFLPDFLDMVIWGHEHECIPHLVHNPDKNFDVLQPGSSVATSLCDAEAQPKYVFILELKDGMPPQLTKMPLKSIRTFKMKSIALRDVDFLRPHDKEAISKYLMTEVEQMIEEATEETKAKVGLQQTEPNDDAADDGIMSDTPLPLIRLRVNYSPSEKKGASTLDYQVENPRRFSNRFVGRVANSNNIVQFYKKKTVTSTAAKHNKGDVAFDENDVQRVLNANGGELHVDTLIADLLGKMQLSLLPEVGMNNAVKQFVDKDDKAALKDFINKEIKNEVKILASNKEFIDNENLDDFKTLVKEVKRANDPGSQSPEKEFQRLRSGKTIVESDDNDAYESKSPNAIGIDTPANKQTSRTTRRTAPKRKAAQKAPVSDSIVISDEDDQMIIDSDNSEDRKTRDYKKPQTAQNVEELDDGDDDSFCSYNAEHYFSGGESMEDFSDDYDAFNCKLDQPEKEPEPEPKPKTRKRTISQSKKGASTTKTTSKSSEPVAKSKTSKATPKTDVLSQLLARKRR